MKETDGIDCPQSEPSVFLFPRAMSQAAVHKASYGRLGQLVNAARVNTNVSEGHIPPDSRAMGE